MRREVGDERREGCEARGVRGARRETRGARGARREAGDERREGMRREA